MVATPTEIVNTFVSAPSRGRGTKGLWVSSRQTTGSARISQGDRLRADWSASSPDAMDSREMR